MFEVASQRILDQISPIHEIDFRSTEKNLKSLKKDGGAGRENQRGATRQSRQEGTVDIMQKEEKPVKKGGKDTIIISSPFEQEKIEQIKEAEDCKNAIAKYN